MSFTTSPIDPSFAMQQAESARVNNASNLAGGRTMNDAAMDEAAQEFEAMFLAQMLKPMFEGVDTNALFGGGKGEDVFSSLMIEEYGAALADSGGVGLADTIKAAMLKLQETT